MRRAAVVAALRGEIATGHPRRGAMAAGFELIARALGGREGLVGLVEPPLLEQGATSTSWALLMRSSRSGRSPIRPSACRACCSASWTWPILRFTCAIDETTSAASASVPASRSIRNEQSSMNWPTSGQDTAQDLIFVNYNPQMIPLKSFVIKLLLSS